MDNITYLDRNQNLYVQYMDMKSEELNIAMVINEEWNY